MSADSSRPALRRRARPHPKATAPPRKSSTSCSRAASAVGASLLPGATARSSSFSRLCNQEAAHLLNLKLQLTWHSIQAENVRLTAILQRATGTFICFWKPMAYTHILLLSCQLPSCPLLSCKAKVLRCPVENAVHKSAAGTSLPTCHMAWQAAADHIDLVLLAISLK